MVKRSFFIIIFALLSSSCVYFNTFYNAKQKFKQAEQSQQRADLNRQQTNVEIVNRADMPEEPSISLNDKTLYKAAIDKANKVAIFHPNSKYVDDALWIIGKSRYNMGEFTTSDKRLRELVVKFPDSKYIDEAYFYIGMSQFWLKKYDLAFDAFDHLQKIKKNPYRDDAAFMNAYMDFIQGNYKSSNSSFSKFLKDFAKSDSAATAQFFIGVGYDSLGDYSQALQAYSRVDRYKPSRELYFDAQYAYGSTAFKADSIELGMRIFDDLSRQERYFTRSSIIRLKLAEGMNLSGKNEDAIKEYLKITEQFPKTEQSTEAYYYLGLIYQNNIYDLASAKDYFNKATQEKRDSPFRNLAIARAAQITKLENYREKLKKDSRASPPGDSLSSPPDDGQASGKPVAGNDESQRPVKNPDEYQKLVEQRMSDSLNSLLQLSPGEYSPPKINPDTLQPSLALDKSDKAKTDSVAADSQSVSNDIEIMFLLAELYHHDLNRPDSALNEYLLLAQSYPQSAYAPRALLASAFIFEDRGEESAADSIYKRIVRSYPSSAQARYAISKIEGASIPINENPAALFQKAEDLYFVAGNADSAIEMLNSIESTFPQSDYAAKSAFTRAWIVDETQALDGDSVSYRAFAEVADKYPETAYAENAKIKMGLIKKQQPAKQPNKPAGEQGQPLSPEEDSLARVRADSLRKLAYTLPRAPAVKDTGEFLYPQDLLNEKRKGVVTFKIKLDLFGNVIDYELLGPSGNAEIDSVAIVALRNTTFDMSTVQDLSTLDDYFRYDIRFEPPELDEFYNPYRDREDWGK